MLPLVIKSNPVEGFSKVGDRNLFVLPITKGTKPKMSDEVALFSSEVNGGQGLYALGQVTGMSNLSDVQVQITKTQPLSSLRKSDFSKLDRKASATPIEKLNQLLYIRSHNKVAGIDVPTFNFLAQKFI